MGCFFSKSSARGDGGGHAGDRALISDQEYGWSYEERSLPPTAAAAAAAAAAAGTDAGRDGIGRKLPISREDFLISRKKGQTVLRLPGSVAGQGLQIEDCEDCDIFICDVTGGVNVDECYRCRFFIAPTQGPVFLRNVANSVVVCAAQQFRTRDCADLQISLYAANRPIIESSSDLVFACFEYFYFNLPTQFRQAKLSIFNNTWSQIHDFSSRANQAPNYRFSRPEDPPFSKLLRPLWEVDSGHFSPEEVEMSEQTAVVPKTMPVEETRSFRQQRIVFFPPGMASEASNVVVYMTSSSNTRTWHLLRTRESLLSGAQLRAIHLDVRLWSAGPLIGILLGSQASDDEADDSLAILLGQLLGEKQPKVIVEREMSRAEMFFDSFPATV